MILLSPEYTALLITTIFHPQQAVVFSEKSQKTPNLATIKLQTYKFSNWLVNIAEHVNSQIFPLGVDEHQVNVGFVRWPEIRLQ